MPAPPKTWLTPVEVEYLDIERSSTIRSEYIDGEMVATSGGNWEHSLKDAGC